MAGGDASSLAAADERPVGQAAATAPYSVAYTRYVLGVALLAMVFNNVDRTILSILVEPIKREFQLSDAAIGAAMGLAFTLVHSIVSLPVARWADFGVRRSIVALGLFVWSGFTAATAAVQSFAQLFAMRMGVGIGEAAGVAPILSLLADYVPPQRRGRGLSGVSIGAVTGLGLGMVAGGWINERWGWRAAFLAAGVPGILLAALVRFTVREPMRGGSEAGQRSLAGERALAAVRHLLGMRTYRPLVAANALAIFASLGRNLWEPSFLIRSYGMGTASAGAWYFAIGPVPAMLGIYLGGRLADQLGARDPRWQLWVPAAGQIAAVPLLLAFLLWPADHVVALPAIGAIPVAFLISSVGSVIGSFYTAPFLSTVQGISPLRTRALAAAIMSLISSLVGMAAGPLLVGVMSDAFEARFGAEALRYALLIPTVVPLLSALVCLIGARSVRTDLERAARDAPPR